jgi:hypothetical protein
VSYLYLVCEVASLSERSFTLLAPMSRIPNVSTRIVPKNVALPETGSCFDTTVVVPRRRTSPSADDDALHIGAFSVSKASKPNTIDQFLRKNTGSGGSVDVERNKAEKQESLGSPRSKTQQQQRLAFKERANPPDTSFRRFYERGDLPIQIDHGGVRNMVAWKVDITKVSGWVEQTSRGRQRLMCSLCCARSSTFTTISPFSLTACAKSKSRTHSCRSKASRTCSSTPAPRCCP